jgi:hypothetical protein
MINKYVKRYIDFNDFQKELDWKDPIMSKCSALFINFLNDYKIYDKFVTNLKKTDMFWREEHWDDIDYFYIESKDQVIENSFFWSDTPQDYPFWESYSLKWIRFLNNHYKNK